MKSPIKTSIEVKVDAAASKQLVEVICDVLSPGSEFLGAVGDKLRAYRTESSIRAFIQADRLAKEAGLTLKAPPMKFLVPFVEASSLEDETDENLTELWARLLVSASTEYTEFHQAYIGALVRIGPISAAVLQQISRSAPGLAPSGRIQRASFVHDALGVESGRQAIAERFNYFYNESDLETFRKSFDVAGTMLKRIETYFPSEISCEGPRWAELKAGYKMTSLNKAIEVLSRENVIQAVDAPWKDLDGIMVTGIIRYLILTDLGEGFINACIGAPNSAL
jgi:hypothetical protein